MKEARTDRAFSQDSVKPSLSRLDLDNLAESQERSVQKYPSVECGTTVPSRVLKPLRTPFDFLCKNWHRSYGLMLTLTHSLSETIAGRACLSCLPTWRAT